MSYHVIRHYRSDYARSTYYYRRNLSCIMLVKQIYVALIGCSNLTAWSSQFFD